MAGISDFFGGVGDAIGSLLGTNNKGAIASAQSQLDTILGKSNAVSAQNRGIYDDYYKQMQGLYGEGAGSYSDAVKNLADAIEGRQDFSYNKSVDEFLDPARNQRVSAAMDAINNSASAGGNRFSSNYLDKVAAKQQALASEEWSKAYDKLMADRQQQLQEWQTGQQKINNLGTLANLYQGDRNQLGNAIGDYYSALANQNNADLQTYSDVTTGKANLGAQATSGVGQALGPIAQVASAIFG